MILKKSTLTWFVHPGSEHGPDKNSQIKSWNRRDHRRKFLETSANVFDPKKGVIKSVCVRYWGEWEPESRVIAKFAPKNFGPKWLHSPVKPIRRDIQNILKNTDPRGCQGTSCGKPGENYQNTDPFVFNGPFCYGICKLTTKRGKSLTQMSKLSKGDVILFGSTKKSKNQDIIFQLDTVFVISHVIDYDPSNLKSLERNKKVPKNYLDWSLRLAHASSKPGCLNLKLYLGATYDDPCNGMYSYVPAQRAEDSPHGFPRIQIKTKPSLPLTIQKPKCIAKTENEMFDFWNKLRKEVAKQNCIQAIYLHV